MSANQQSSDQPSRELRAKGVQQEKQLQKGEAKSRKSAGTEDGKKCPHCRHSLHKNADICEACGQWVLDEQCCFCYAPYKQGQKFCGNCGNPPRGIACKKCGNVSIFDICTKCGEGVSRNADKTKEALRLQVEKEAAEIKQAFLKKSAEEQDAAGQHEDLQRKVEQEAAENKKAEAIQRMKESAKKLEKYYNQDQGKANPGETSAPDYSYKNAAGSEIAANLEKARQYAEKKEAERKAGMAAALKEKCLALQKKEFNTNQEARLYYESIRQSLALLMDCPSILGWQCVYANCVHYNGPSGCEAPWKGGRWICRSEVEFINADEFILNGVLYSPGEETPYIAENS